MLQTGKDQDGAEFAGPDEDNGDCFDQSFTGLLKPASNQISIR
jgi:hypothetical protein